MTRHYLKTWPGPFAAVWDGRKTYEIRTDDRSFAVGDVLMLEEWDQIARRYVGPRIEVTVTYKTEGGEWGLPEGLCVLGLDMERRQCVADPGARP